MISILRAGVRVSDEAHDRLKALRNVAHRALNTGIRAIFSHPEDVAPQTHAYRMIRDALKDLNVPGGTTAAFSSEAWARWKALSKEMARGDASIPSFRYPAPIFVRAQEWRIPDPGEHVIEVKLWGRGGQPWTRIELYPPQKSKKRRRVKDHGYWFDRWENLNRPDARKDLKIVWDKRRRQWMAIMAFGFEPKPVKADGLLAVHLGMTVPVQVVGEDGQSRTVGEPKEVWDFRSRMVQMRRMRGNQTRDRRGAPDVGGSKGFKRRHRRLMSLRDREDRWIDTKAKQYAAAVIKTAKRWQLGTIVLGDPNGIVDNARNTDRGDRERVEAIVTMFWQPARLLAQIEQTAKREGLVVLREREAYGSTTCSVCEHCEADNRKSRAEFECRKCGRKNNAEIEAGLNLLRKAKIAL